MANSTKFLGNGQANRFFTRRHHVPVAVPEVKLP